MGRLSGGSAPKQKVCGGSATVNGENLDIFDRRAYSRRTQLSQIGQAYVNPFMLTANFASASLTAKIATSGVPAFDRLILNAIGRTC
jgi:hypothetical protein